jgi:CBS domain containing-hemolysin-like protein
LTVTILLVSLGVWLSVAVLILVNALYVAAEFGAVGVRRSRVRRMSEDGHGLARRLLPHIEDPASLDRYVSVSQIGITASSLVLGAVAQATLAVALAPRLARDLSLPPTAAASTAAVCVLIGLTALQVVVAELVPKSLALQFPTRAALWTVVPIEWSLRAFRPFIALLNGAATLLLRLFGVRATAHRHLHSPDEIALFIAESRDGGLLEPDEQQRLHRALQLSLRTARDLMVPRDRLLMLAVDTPWDEVVRRVVASPFSRLPVYRGTPDQVIGTLRVEDLVFRFVAGGPAPLDRLVRPVARISPDLAADHVVAALRERRAHQAVVVDATGAMLGLVTIQDVVGELLGAVRAPGA